MTNHDFDPQARALVEHAIDREQIDAALAELGKTLGTGPLALDDTGQVRLRVDGDLELTLAHVPGVAGFVAAAPIISAPLDRPEILRTLMQANLSWPLIQGGTFAMPPGREVAMFCRVLPLFGAGAQEMDGQLAAFVDLVRFWNAEIAHALETDAKHRRSAETGVPPSAVRV